MDMTAFEQKAMDKHGFYSHIITSGDPGVPYGFNYHTHGLPLSLGHLDFQIVLPMPPESAHDIIHGIVHSIRSAQKTFVAGQRYEHIIKNYEVTFIEAVENTRKVLRLILPDTNGSLTEETLSDYFKKQYELSSHVSTEFH